MGNQQSADTQSVGGRSMIGITSVLKRGILWSIGEAERIKGSMPITAEVIVVFFKHYTRHFSGGYINAFI